MIRFQICIFDILNTAMEKIGKSLNTTAMAYTDAMKKLKTGNGNLIGRVEKLKVMGVKAKKNLPAVNEEEEEN